MAPQKAKRVQLSMDDHIKTTIATYDKIAADYCLTAIPELCAWVEESMRIFGGMLPGKSVLVPGCGDGRDSRFLKSIGLSVLSFDLSEGMLNLATKNDPCGDYRRLDLRSISELRGPFDGIYASGCLYHITRSEFSNFLLAVTSIMSEKGIFYLNMKLGRGSEIKDTPGENYPGGKMAQAALAGARYYEYYSHQELLSLFRGYSVRKWRNMEVQHEGVHEYWLAKE